MAYTINLTNGSIFATIADGTVNTASSMTLVGKNYAGYGEFLDENFIHLLENAANTSAPGSPLTGQLWWDSTNALMKVYNGTAFKVMTGSTSSASAPSNVITGDLWWDTTNAQLKVYNGASFTVVGPAFTSAEGTAGAIPETITDSGATPHYVTSLYVNNTRVAIVSKDSNFTPSAPTVTTFPTIYNGITLYNTGSPVYAGSATNAQLLDNLDSTDFMRATASTSTTGTLAVLNNSGLTVGAANVFAVNTTATDANIKSNISNGNLVIQANVGGITYNVAQAVGSTGVFAVSNAMTAGTTISAVGNVTGGNIRTAGQVSATGNVTGGNVISAAAVSGVSLVSSGNVDSGNLRTSGLVSAAGNITSAANVAGTFFIGNGSQLTGLSLGVSVTKFVNGTSEGNVGASGGNINFNVGGVSNVVVIDTTTLYTNVVSAQSITKSGSNAVGNIGSSTQFFNTVFGNIYNGTIVSVAGNITGSNINTGGLISATGNVIGGNINGGANVNATSLTGSVVSVSGNITAGNVLGGGTVTATSHTGTVVSMSGNVTSGNLNAAGLSLSSNVVSALNSTSAITTSANVTGGNLLTAGLISATGNITTSGVFNGTFAGNISGNLTVPGSNTQVLYNNIGNAGASAGFTFNSTSNAVAVTGNITGGNLNAAGLSLSSNVVSALVSAANITTTANISGNYVLGNGALLTGVITSVANINSGTSNVTVVSSGGNITVGVAGTGNVAVFASSGVFVTGVISASGNITGGNLSGTSIVGTLTTAAQTNITSVGTLTSLAVTGNITGGNLITGGLVSTASITKTGSNAVGNIGSSSNYFNQVFATATTALYADVAERFAADAVLEPGTVVELGGSKEITRAITDLSENVFGVISTRPAYTMNGGAGEDATHPKVAMTGRVPVNVVGIIRKGDRLVSAGAGLARAAQPGEATAFNVIGRSLVDKNTAEQGTVEAIVTINN